MYRAPCAMASITIDTMKPSPSSTKPALTERDIGTLQRLLDRVPAPLEPLDVSVLDGFLCALSLHPVAIPAPQWLHFVTDSEGRPLPDDFDARSLHTLVERRHAELTDAIAQRTWFDPWVFELQAQASPSESVYPWVAGFAMAVQLFPALTRDDSVALIEPLALLYRHLDSEDLEDADELLAEIATLEPAADLAEAVEDLVRATLLWADVTRPRVKPQVPAPRRAAPRGSRGNGRR
jgi:uncharacterized protein